jgi:hypothetical protein
MGFSKREREAIRGQCAIVRVQPALPTDQPKGSLTTGEFLMAASINPTPPTTPTGPLKTGTTGVDTIGQVWFIGLNGLTYLVTWTGAIPRMAEVESEPAAETKTKSKTKGKWDAD